MERPKVAIIDNDPEKLKRYQEAIQKIGGTVVASASNFDDARHLLWSFGESPETTPDFILTDAVLDPSGYKRQLDMWGSIRKLRDTQHKPWPPMPQTDGGRITEEIRRMQDPSVAKHYGSVLSPDLKVVGISDGLGISGADVARATPEQAVDYIQNL